MGHWRGLVIQMDVFGQAGTSAVQDVAWRTWPSYGRWARVSAMVMATVTVRPSLFSISFCAHSQLIGIVAR